VHKGPLSRAPRIWADSIRVVGFIGDHNRTQLESLEQGLCAGDVMFLARRDQHAYRAAFRIDPRVDLRGLATHLTCPHRQRAGVPRVNSEPTKIPSLLRLCCTQRWAIASFCSNKL
jgi:hypothetical protein